MTNDSNNPEPDSINQANLQPMSCDASIEELYSYLDGVLDQSKANSIKSHLASCPGCDDVYNFHGRLQSLVGQMGRAEMPAELPQRVFNSILGDFPSQTSPFGDRDVASPLDPPDRPFEI